MALWLRRLGAEVVGIALPPPTEPSFCRAVGLEGLIDSRIGDIRTERRPSKGIGSEDFDLVIHMAAQAIVRSVLPGAGRHLPDQRHGHSRRARGGRGSPSLKAVIAVTSYKCYENRDGVGGYREQIPMGGKHLQLLEGIAELVDASYRSSFFRNRKVRSCLGVRAGNVFGGGDWVSTAGSPTLSARPKSGEPIADPQNPNAVRPGCMCLEPLRGYLMLAARLVEDGARLRRRLEFRSQSEVDYRGRDPGQNRRVALAGPRPPLHLRARHRQVQGRERRQSRQHESTVGARLDALHVN